MPPHRAPLEAAARHAIDCLESLPERPVRAKWLNAPYDSGYAFIRHPEEQRAAMSHRAAYLTHDAEARDQIDWNPEWSRRARGFST